MIANTKPPMVSPEGKRQSNPRPGLPLQTSQSFDQGVNGTNIPGKLMSPDSATMAPFFLFFLSVYLNSKVWGKPVNLALSE